LKSELAELRLICNLPAGLRCAPRREELVDLGIANKQALVLGGSSGIGLGIATSLAKEGVNVTIASRDRGKLAAAADFIENACGRKANSLVCDLSSPDSVGELLEALPIVDIAVLNSGGPQPGGALDITAEAWPKQFQTMFLSLVRIAGAYIPHMRQQRFGRLLVVVSSGVIQPIPNLVMSNALRNALVGWAKTLSREVAADGITVNCLAPGRIDTPRLHALDANMAEREGLAVETVSERAVRQIPAGRLGTIEEFGDVACFVASVKASYVNGSILRIDGGSISSL
jgi:3-oxoacyl-[acyl-carrier protein] reductase